MILPSVVRSGVMPTSPCDAAIADAKRDHFVEDRARCRSGRTARAPRRGTRARASGGRCGWPSARPAARRSRRGALDVARAATAGSLNGSTTTRPSVPARPAVSATACGASCAPTSDELGAHRPAHVVVRAVVAALELDDLRRSGGCSKARARTRTAIITASLPELAKRMRSAPGRRSSSSSASSTSCIGRCEVRRAERHLRRDRGDHDRMRVAERQRRRVEPEIGERAAVDVDHLTCRCARVTNVGCGPRMIASRV